MFRKKIFLSDIRLPSAVIIGFLHSSQHPHDIFLDYYRHRDAIAVTHVLILYRRGEMYYVSSLQTVMLLFHAKSVG